MTFSSGGSERLRIFTTGDVLVTSAGGGLGYGTGSGGTVTQATSKGTSVTLNKPTGQITMNNAALLPTASVSFYLSNSLIGVYDILMVGPGGASWSNYTFQVTQLYTSNALIKVTNISAGSLSEAVVISFTLFKGSAS
jgi:hypothetical protein